MFKTYKVRIQDWTQVHLAENGSDLQKHGCNMIQTFEMKIITKKAHILVTSIGTNTGRSIQFNNEKVNKCKY